jgi:hypothetical protein
VTGTSKGRGFQGVVKRHGFNGEPRTHGQSDRLRAPGSIGAGTRPRSRVQEHAHGRTHGWTACDSYESLGRRGYQRPQPSTRTGISTRCQKWLGNGTPCSEGQVGVE